MSGTTGNHAQPVGSTGGYYAVGPSDGNPGTINLSGWGDIFNLSLIWGSVDTYNRLDFLDGSNNVLASFVGSNIWVPANGNQSDPNTNPVVNFLLSGADVSAFASLRLTSSSNAFEIDNVAINSAVPEPGTWAMMLLGFGAVGFAMRRRRQPKTDISSNRLSHVIIETGCRRESWRRFRKTPMSAFHPLLTL